MSSFVEEAVLRLRDESSKNISKINSELKKLAATANSLKSQTINFNIKDAGLAKALADINRLQAGVNQLKSAGPINLRVNTAQAAAAIGFVISYRRLSPGRRSGRRRRQKSK